MTLAEGMHAGRPAEAPCGRWRRDEDSRAQKAGQ